MPAKGMLHTPVGDRSQLSEKLGGGILVAGGSHILDLACHFLGRPRQVFAQMQIPAPRDYDLLTTAHLVTSNGPCLFEAMMSPLRRGGFLRDGWDERLELTGTRGRLEVFSPMWDKLDQKPSLVVHYDEACGAETEHRFPPTPAFTQEVAFFLDQVARSDQGPQSRRTGYDVDQLIEDITRSAKTGQAVDVNWRI
jgi:predicted dehydrogenase